MKRLRVVIALGSSLMTGACQTISAPVNGVTRADRPSVAAATAAPFAPSVRATRAGISRPSAQNEPAAPVSNFAGTSSRTIVLLLAVAAVIVIGVVLLSGDDGEGIY